MSYELVITVVINLVLLVIGYTKLVAKISEFLANQKSEAKNQVQKDKLQDEKQKEIEKDLSLLNKKIDNSISDFNKLVTQQAEKHSVEMKMLEKQRLSEIEKSNKNTEEILKIVTNIETKVAVINNTAGLKNEEFEKRINKLEVNSETPKLQRGRPRGK